MPTTETTYRVRVSPPSRLRTELNIIAAVVAVGLCLVILALLANTPPPGAAHRPDRSTHPRVGAVSATHARVFAAR